MIFQNRQRFFNRRIQQLSDRFAFVLYGKRLAVVTRAAADVAQHIYIRKKVHLDAFEAFAFATFAATAFNVERKAPGLVTTLARFRKHGVKLTDWREQAGVGRRI